MPTVDNKVNRLISGRGLLISVAKRLIIDYMEVMSLIKVALLRLEIGIC